MPIRIARYSDLPTISSILAASFYDEELHAYFFPRRQQYPNDHVRAWYQKVLKCWWDYSKVFVVSYDEAEKDAEVITGVAEWQRVGDGWEGLWGSGRWDPRAYISSAVNIRNHLSDLIFSNRASILPTPEDPNPLTHDNFESRIGPFMHHFYDHPDRRQHWELLTLGVHPNHQRRGIGRKLAAWGLERARSEGVLAVVCAAKGLEAFYQSCGFVDIVGSASEAKVEGLVNPLEERGMGGGAVLWTSRSEDQVVKMEGKLSSWSRGGI